MNKEVASLFEKLCERENKRISLKDAERELAELVKNKPDVSAASSDDLEELSKAQATLRSLQERVAELSGTIQVVSEIDAKMTAMKQRVAAFNVEVHQQLALAGDY